MEVTDMPYKILVWIPVEPEDPEIYERRLDALVDLQSLRLMQPENIYKIVKVDEGDSS
jgi:hypothetical protein